MARNPIDAPECWDTVTIGGQTIPPSVPRVRGVLGIRTLVPKPDGCPRGVACCSDPSPLVGFRHASTMGLPAPLSSGWTRPSPPGAWRALALVMATAPHRS